MSSVGQFRLDINALRAWAVAVVVLFHFGVPGFAGGFVGVDVFFVISGFLMMRIIMKGLADGRFSVWQFYLARARRIIPALLALAGVLILLGWFLLTSADYQLLARHVVSAVLFTSNTRFASEAGYFDTESHEKWLLHTWSLSVEWQFYLLLPLFLMLLWRLWPQQLAVVLAGCTLVLLASLSWSVWASWHEPAKAFYLLPSRAWEMLAGGLLYFCEGRLAWGERWRRCIALAGYALMLLSVLGMTGDMPWPGLTALLPVTGAMLVILAARSDGWLVRARPLQWLGTRSYSVYLWHWPIVVVFGYAGLPLVGWPVFAGILLALLLGELSFRLVEERGRLRLGQMPVRRAFFVVLISVSMVVVPARLIRAYDGVPIRLPADVVAVERLAVEKNPHRARCHGGKDNLPQACAYGEGPLGVVMLGDSHASAVATALEAALPVMPAARAEVMSHTSCPTILGVRKTAQSAACEAFNAWAFARVRALSPEVPVIITNRLSEYLFGKDGRPMIHFGMRHEHSDNAFRQEVAGRMLATYCALAAERPVYIMLPIPEMPRRVPDAMARGRLYGQETSMMIGQDEYLQRHGFVLQVLERARRQCGVHLLDPRPMLCSQGYCLGERDGMPLYSDDNHLNEYGNKLLVPMLKGVVRSEDAAR